MLGQDTAFEEEPLLSAPEGEHEESDVSPLRRRERIEDELEDPPDQHCRDEPPSIDSYGLACLCLQHSSSSFGDRLAEFAFPLYLVTLFSNTLLPASIYGFVITIFGVLFSGSVAALIDYTPRLRAVRFCIVGQKVSAAAAYALFLTMFSKSQGHAAPEKGGMGDVMILQSQDLTVWFLFSGIVLGGSILKLATVGINVAVERDWTMKISNGSQEILTRINLIMRRVDLLSSLIAPVFVSLLTTAGSYIFSIYFLVGLSCLSAIFEFVWIEVVYLRFPELKQTQLGQHILGEAQVQPNRPSSWQLADHGIRARVQTWYNAVRSWSKIQHDDWKTFASYPVFMSSVSISLLYLSVLSFDPTFLSYLKSTTDFSDLFISGMRGICVLTGLLGTFIVPVLQRNLGLARTGSWSIAAELIPLIPTLVTFYVGASYHRPKWNAVLLFTGLALSRIGLWSFDVVQLTQLQMALADHPRRNALTGLHFALQNIFDLAHYSLTIAWSSPGQFKYAATVSCFSVFLAFMVYVFGYARRVRGHVLHLEYLYSLFLKRREVQPVGWDAQ